MAKHVLMVAYHYPPFRGSSGIQRTLKFSRYLPEHGWQPVVLTPHPRAYPSVGDDLLKDIPEQIVVQRALALDVGRHFAFRGIYPSWLAIPDRYASWLLGAVPAGLRLIRRYRPALVWTTYPVPTAHLIGYMLHRLTGLPWVADFRDPMLYEAWPVDPLSRRIHAWLERLTVRHCTRAVFTTPGTLELYAGRYPEIPRSRWAVIANGYDEENFSGVEMAAGRVPGGSAVLVHAGQLDPLDRDPSQFFLALSELKKNGRIVAGDLKVVLRGSGSEQAYRRRIEEADIGDIVFLEGQIPYREALAEMLRADGLLLFQGAPCNRQIPAKAYEYLRAGRPVFGLVDPGGDTWRLLESAGISTLAPPDAKEEIMRGLLEFLDLVKQGRAPVAREDVVTAHSRRALTGELATLFEAVEAES